MTLTNSAPPMWEAKQLTLMAEQVQDTAERIARKMAYYKKMISAPKCCQLATYVRHQQELHHTRDALNVSVNKIDRLTRQFVRASEKVCTKMN